MQMTLVGEEFKVQVLYRTTLNLNPSLENM